MLQQLRLTLALVSLTLAYAGKFIPVNPRERIKTETTAFRWPQQSDASKDVLEKIEIYRKMLEKGKKGSQNNKWTLDQIGNLKTESEQTQQKETTKAVDPQDAIAKERFLKYFLL